MSISKRAEITPAMRSALLVPKVREWALTIRQQNSIDRQIERKLRLLFYVQRRRHTVRRRVRASARPGCAAQARGREKTKIETFLRRPKLECR